jgi:hypothetical protein
MDRPAWRTLIGTLAGLAYLLALAALAGWLHLDAAMVGELALAGAGMVSALAAKAAIEHRSKA